MSAIKNNLAGMNYFTIWKDVLQHRYAKFDGRAARTEFWSFALINLAVFVVLWILMAILRGSGIDKVILVIYWLYCLAIIVPSLAVTFRRLHDTGRTAWWILIDLVPFVGAIVLLIFELLDSEPGDNKYGPNPKGVSGPSMPSATPTPPPAAPMA